MAPVLWHAYDVRLQHSQHSAMLLMWLGDEKTQKNIGRACCGLDKTERERENYENRDPLLGAGVAKS